MVSISLRSASLLTLLSRSCCFSLLMSSLFCFIVLWMNWMFSRMRCFELAPSPFWATATRFSASEIWRNPSSISWKVLIMSLISLSFWLTICFSESTLWAAAISAFEGP